MKKNDLQTVKAKEVDELKKMLLEKKKELKKVVVHMYAGSEKNLKKSKNLRREIAQILTIIKEKEIVAKESKKE